MKKVLLFGSRRCQDDSVSISWGYEIMNIYKSLKKKNVLVCAPTYTVISEFPLHKEKYSTSSEKFQILLLGMGWRG